MPSIVFFDLETSLDGEIIHDMGAIHSNGAVFHKNSLPSLLQFISGAGFIAGHNIVAHDLPVMQKMAGKPIFPADKTIDTLLLSPLLFPKKPYHNLLKDDKLQTEERNNPVNDATKARDLFNDEVAAFNRLPEPLKQILVSLLLPVAGFTGFFHYTGFTEIQTSHETAAIIRLLFGENICTQSDLPLFIHKHPVALAYALALLYSNDRYSITPPWVLRNYPGTERILFLLRNSPCVSGCAYCNKALNPHLALEKYFGFPGFRSYGNEPLQENAVKAAVNNQSLLAVFPTGGGKSITFQLPALMSGENARALTVIISPLQSLMKDQVDNLEQKGITEAVTINGLLDPIERSKAIDRVENGLACMLYISPESLRSVTIERLLLKRKIARFVIDEAHCFSSWGHDFRVDYLYIGDFIRNLQQAKNLDEAIPVSCFTATAKRKVIEDICDYFKNKLNLKLEVFRASSGRTNLHYQVHQKNNEEEKYNQLRIIIESKKCPAIVYVSRTRRAYALAEKLTGDGYEARPYHGKMNKEEKSANQDAFMAGQVNIMVATSAFGMGVDKSDVGAVIHYDISDSLENYIQESGRAGRDEHIEADCHVLFNEEDLDKHFILLNQTKMNIREINQVWRAIKELTKSRNRVSNSALEIARKAGWDDGITDLETRVTTAIAALEDAGYLKRGQNTPRIYANSILANTAQEAIDKINTSPNFTPVQKDKSIRIIKKLFSSKSKRLGTEEQAESRVDYISDQLGIVKEEVIRIIELLREEKILAQTKDLTAFIRSGENSNRSLAISDSYRKLEVFLLSVLKEGENAVYHLKEINEQAIASGIHDSSPNKIKTILNFWAIKNWVKRQQAAYSKNHIQLALLTSKKELEEKQAARHFLAREITGFLYQRSRQYQPDNQYADEVLVEFSVLELKEATEKQQNLFKLKISIDDIEDTLFYLSRIEAIKIEGGFLVAYNRLTIERLESNTRIQYKESDYEKLRLFYQQKVQQIHIVGEYAKKMIRNYEEALRFAEDYFSLNYTSFLNKYFPGSRQDDIKRTLTPEKFRKLFGALSPAQLEIIKDGQSKYIVVAAGPGSGKTRVLVHKLASLLLTEDVKHEQLLMLTFSRAAAGEFKKRLLELIGNAAGFIEIKTFHSFCFDLLCRIGSVAQSETVVKTTVEKIKNGEIERNRITKTVLVIDEAQDMNADEYQLVQALMDANDDMRVILVGDDDQNIFQFRGADSRYMQQLITENGAVKYELTENYRSKNNIVQLANQWAEKIDNRLKSTPGFAIQQTNGQIHIIQYNGKELITPLAKRLQQSSLSGSTCILTKTNEEAGMLTGLLKHYGLPAKLIQTNERFNLANLFEIRTFNKLLNVETGTATISNQQWTEAVKSFQPFIEGNTNAGLLLNLLKEFEQTNPVKKYVSDWNTLLTESKLEDFAGINSETIYISTIHKAKGKEFDNVFLLLQQFDIGPDDHKRQVYVALTRAKTNLTVHYNGNIFNNLMAEQLTYTLDNTIYEAPEQITIALTHQEVNLGYFEFVQHRISGLTSGAPLNI
ncbi:MAG: RecQ family ATP-dependent DNA helicase, partial [Dinghuibacter sp.]|nr:RecQ family ATP-dependent DNA helicase [Dinghuibacter sp.]